MLKIILVVIYRLKTSTSFAYDIHLLSIRFAFLERRNLRHRDRCKRVCISGSSVCDVSTETEVQMTLKLDALRSTTYLDLGLSRR